MEPIIGAALNLDGLSNALAVGAAIGTAKPIGTHQYVVIPEGYEIESLEKYALTPDRKRGVVTMDDAGSFVRYFNMHATAYSQIYAKANPPVFVGILNDHETTSPDSKQIATPGWQDHRVKYVCPFSVEWQEWAKFDKKVMKQSEFADFIERNLPDIVEPAGADMLEISRTLEAKKKVNFASGIRLSNGQTELTYEEDIQGTSAKGLLQIPEIFKIGVAVLEGGAPYAIECRLRYRITDAVLFMWYELVRPHKVLEDAVKAVWEQIAVDTNRRIYNGSI